MTTKTQIKKYILQIVSDEQGLTVKEIAQRARSISDDSSIRKKSCNPILYRESTLFRYEGRAAVGEPPPRWYLRDDIPQTKIPTANPIKNKKATKKKSKKKVAPKKKTRKKAKQNLDRLTLPKLSKDPYPWQEKAIASWQKNDCSGIIEAVTGTGKTFVAVWLIHKYIQEGKRCLIVVPTQVLLRQWKDEIETELGFELTSLLGAGYKQLDINQPITLGVVNSVINAKEDGLIDNEFDLIIADECHRYGSERNQIALLKETPHRLGLTATYDRSDDGLAEILTPYFKQKCFEYKFKDARRDNVIAPFISLSIGTDLTSEERDDYDSCGKTMGQKRNQLIRDYDWPSNFKKFMARYKKPKTKQEGILAGKWFKAMSDRRRILSESEAKISVLPKIQDIIEQSRGALVYCESIDAAEYITDTLSGHGFKVECLHSKLKPHDRENIFDRFRRLETKCIVAIKILDEGINVPEANCAIIVAGSKQRRQMVQRMGRILRKKHDKTGSVFIHIYARNTGEDPELHSTKDEYYLSVLREDAEATKIADGAEFDCKQVFNWIKQNKIW